MDLVLKSFREGIEDPYIPGGLRFVILRIPSASSVFSPTSPPRTTSYMSLVSSFFDPSLAPDSLSLSLPLHLRLNTRPDPLYPQGQGSGFLPRLCTYTPSPFSISTPNTCPLECHPM